MRQSQLLPDVVNFPFPIIHSPFPDPMLNKLSGLFYGWRMVTLFILSGVFYSLLGKSWARPQLS